MQIKLLYASSGLLLSQELMTSFQSVDVNEQLNIVVASSVNLSFNTNLCLSGGLITRSTNKATGKWSEISLKIIDY